MKTNTLFLVISRSFLLRVKNVSGKSCKKKKSKHILCSVTFFFNPAVYEIMWKVS